MPEIFPGELRNERVIVKAAGKFFRIVAFAAEIEAVASELQVVYGFHIFPLLFLIYLQRGKIKYQICQKFAFSTVVFRKHSGIINTERIK